MCIYCKEHGWSILTLLLDGEQILSSWLCLYINDGRKQALALNNAVFKYDRSCVCDHSTPLHQPFFSALHRPPPCTFQGIFLLVMLTNDL